MPQVFKRKSGQAQFYATTSSRQKLYVWILPVKETYMQENFQTMYLDEETYMPEFFWTN
jgi:hypothetical protein